MGVPGDELGQGCVAFGEEPGSPRLVLVLLGSLGDELGGATFEGVDEVLDRCPLCELLGETPDLSVAGVLEEGARLLDLVDQGLVEGWVGESLVASGEALGEVAVGEGLLAPLLPSQGNGLVRRLRIVLRPGAGTAHPFGSCSTAHAACRWDFKTLDGRAGPRLGRAGAQLALRRCSTGCFADKLAFVVPLGLRFALAAAIVTSTACLRAPPALPVEQPQTQAPRGDPTRLLDGHLTARLPASARVVVPMHSVMGAPEPVAERTEVFIEEMAGSDRPRFAMVVTELFLRSSGDAEADARHIAAKGERVEPLADASLPIQVLAADDPGQGTFLLAAVIAHPDGTLQEVEFHLDRRSAHRRAHFEALARELLGTFEAGPRRLEAPGGDLELAGGLQVQVPEGFVATHKEGPDFDVYRILELAVAGESASTLGVYFGGHPSLQHSQADEPSAGSEQPGTLLDQPVQWVRWTTANGTTVKEAIAPVGEHQFVHVFAFAPDPAAMPSLEAIIGTLRSP